MAEYDDDSLENIDQVDEIQETAAADTLKPMGAPGDSKAVVLSTFTQLLAQLGQEDLSYLFDQVQSQYGPGTPANPDNSAQNKATIKSDGAAPADPMPTLGVKEEVEEMFGGTEALSEEFKERAEVVFEAALNTRLTLETVRIEEEFAAKEEALREELETTLEEKTTEIFEELVEKMNQYMDYSINEWKEENTIALEAGLRSEIAEDFLNGLHNLFTEHYITVPETELDIVAEMKERMDSLESKLNESVDENVTLKADLLEARRVQILDELAEGLTLSQSEKLRTLSENVVCEDAEVFGRKMNMIKENYFNTTKATTSTGIITEEAEPAADGVDVEPTGAMAAYIKTAVKGAKN